MPGRRSPTASPDRIGRLPRLGTRVSFPVAALHKWSTRKADLQQLDLGSLRSIREAADQLRASHPGLDLLINNAGVMIPPKELTDDGFELQFGANSLGHFCTRWSMTAPMSVCRTTLVIACGRPRPTASVGRRTWARLIPKWRSPRGMPISPRLRPHGLVSEPSTRCTTRMWSTRTSRGCGSRRPKGRAQP